MEHREDNYSIFMGPIDPMSGNIIEEAIISDDGHYEDISREEIAHAIFSGDKSSDWSRNRLNTEQDSMFEARKKLSGSPQQLQDDFVLKAIFGVLHLGIPLPRENFAIALLDRQHSFVEELPEFEWAASKRDETINLSAFVEVKYFPFDGPTMTATLHAAGCVLVERSKSLLTGKGVICAMVPHQNGATFTSKARWGRHRECAFHTLLRKSSQSSLNSSAIEALRGDSLQYQSSTVRCTIFIVSTSRAYLSVPSRLFQSSEASYFR